MSAIDLNALAYELCELAGQKLYQIYQFLRHNPLLIKVIESRAKRIKAQKKSISEKATSAWRRKPTHEEIEEEDDDDYTPKTSAEREKLRKLEEELARLRQEMAKFMQQSAANKKEQDVDSSKMELVDSDSLADPEAGSPLPNAPVFAPPPPPPPPPVAPPLPPSTPVQKKKATNEENKENIENVSTTPRKRIVPTLQEAGPRQSLAELVRQASQSRVLRRVEGERSPGGTLKRKKDHNYCSNHPQDLLVHALRQKFKSLSSPASSPEKNSPNNTAFDDEFGN